MDVSLNTQSAAPLWNGPSIETFHSSPEVPLSREPVMETPFEANPVFQIGDQMLADAGGVTNPAGVLRSQVQMLALEMNWILSAQLANKATSGVQTLFNNQV